MPLFDKEAKRLRDRPSLLFPADPGHALADLLHSYDPNLNSAPGKLRFGNGVRLYGPIAVTPDLERKAKLPPGMTTAYYTVVAFGSEAKGRPEDAMWQDAERLVRAVAARLGGTVHDQRPPMKLKLEVAVWSPRPLPVEQVIGVLQPFVDTGDFFVDEKGPDVAQDGYALATEERPPFFVLYWPPRLSRSQAGRPPPALGGQCGDEPCRWVLHGFGTVEDTPRDVALNIGKAALALARTAGGIIIDPYGFPVDRAEDLLPSPR
jgi:hypothetical protein